MANLYVCGLAEMPANVAELRPRYVVSLLQPDFQPETPAEIDPAHHHRAVIDDIEDPLPGRILPGSSHIEALIAFLQQADRDASMLIHCWAGISRSPATALVALALDAPGRELEAAQLLRRAAPHVQPNPRVIALADEILGRGGALVEAAGEMGFASFEESPLVVRLPRRLQDRA